VQINLSGHHYTVSDRTRTYVEAEAAKLEKFFSPIIDVHATITEEGRRHKADLVVNIQAHTLKSSGEDEKIYPAIDQAVNRMVSQLKKMHDKQRDHRGENRDELSIGG
jgi:putative sigma-54 modulation protein